MTNPLLRQARHLFWTAGFLLLVAFTNCAALTVTTTSNAFTNTGSVMGDVVNLTGNSLSNTGSSAGNPPVKLA